MISKRAMVKSLLNKNFENFSFSTSTALNALSALAWRAVCVELFHVFDNHSSSSESIAHDAEGVMGYRLITLQIWRELFATSGLLITYILVVAQPIRTQH